MQYVPLIGIFSAAPPGFPHLGWAQDAKEDQDAVGTKALQLRLCLKGLLLPLKVQHGLLLKGSFQERLCGAKMRASLEARCEGSSCYQA